MLPDSSSASDQLRPRATASDRPRIQVRHPWQRPPTEQILGALQLLSRNNDVSRRQAFLLLDQGVETLFKTYLTLPASVTNVATPENERIRATQGKFPELLQGVTAAAKGRVAAEDFDAVWYYHRLRNKLQHEEPGITVVASQVDGFAKLTVRLLKDLLAVDLDQQLIAREPARPSAVKAQPVPDVMTRDVTQRRSLDPEKTTKYESSVGGYSEFFDDLVERFSLAYPGAIGKAKVTERSYYAFSSGRSGFRFHWAFTSKREFQVELYIDVQDKTRNKAILDELRRGRSQIETSIGETLRWDPLPTRRGSRVYLARPGQITDPAEHLEELMGWGIEKMMKFVDTFRPRILQINVDS
jgi:hypothetical protein